MKTVKAKALKPIKDRKDPQDFNDEDALRAEYKDVIYAVIDMDKDKRIF